ncbi:MAG: VOC family protein [Gemmatimonadaceae bacterium]
MIVRVLRRESVTVPAVALLLAEYDPLLSPAEPVHITNIAAQLRTTDLAASIAFYTTKLGFTLDFQHDDFYAGVSAGGYVVHLKLVDEADPSIAYAQRGEHFHLYLATSDVMADADRLRTAGVRFVRDVHETPWGTREFVIEDEQGHTLYFGQRN